ncbi:GNAT family N-acetyltransferase [Streptomyces sp. SCSIO ZS0520]|uniref:GNAT family N-acetyltransferase n=1 Tax=Streptomyces sp. SCSIO ZS0520 TaxID=2892996 RepID=UPI0021D83646|nr:GNAT family N-acetyltransferase [Streptomyces sp. SCSIO ZS0520]
MTRDGLASTDNTVGVRHVRGADDLPGWDALAQGAPFYLSSHWLRFVDTSPTGEPHYFALEDGPDLVAGLPTHWNPREPHSGYQPATLLGAQGGGPALTVGGRRGYCSALLAAPGRSEAAAAEHTAKLLAHALEELPQAEGRWWWPYLTPDAVDTAVAAARLLGPLSAEEIHLVGADCVVDLIGESPEDLRHSLPTRQRRTNWQREMRRFEESGLRIRRTRLSEVCEEGASLLAQVQWKYGHDETVEQQRSSLRRQAEHLDDLSVVFEARDAEGRLVGFSLCYDWGTELSLRLVGFDYATAQDSATYAQVMLHAPLQYCYERGLRRLHLGTESYEAKCRRGARVRPLWALAPGVSVRGSAVLDRATRLAAALPAGEAARFVEAIRTSPLS